MPNVELNTIKFVFCWIYWISLFFKDHQARCFQHTSPVYNAIRVKVFCSIKFRASRYFICCCKSSVTFSIFMRNCNFPGYGTKHNSQQQSFSVAYFVHSRRRCRCCIRWDYVPVYLPSAICTCFLEHVKEWLVCILRKKMCHYSNKVWCFYGLLKHKDGFSLSTTQTTKKTFIWLYEDILV